MPKFRLDGVEVTVPEGALVLAALDPFHTRTSVSGEPRGPLCGMGQCYECRVNVNGKEALACMTPAREGMEVRRG